jgi:hypothetical protein
MANNSEFPRYNNIEFPPYVFQEYPKVVKLRNGTDVIVSSKRDEIETLGRDDTDMPEEMKRQVALMEYVGELEAKVKALEERNQTKVSPVPVSADVHETKQIPAPTKPSALPVSGPFAGVTIDELVKGK